MMRFFACAVRQLPSVLVLAIFLVTSAAVKAQAGGVAVDVTGEASVVVFDDFENNRSELRYYIADQKSKRERQLHFQNQAPTFFKTGKKVRVRGRGRPDDGIDVDNIAEIDGSPSGSDSQSATEAALAPPETRKILTLLVDFNDATVTGGNYGTTVQAVRNRLFNESKSVAGLFFNASLGTLTFDPDGDGDGQQDVFHVSINDTYIGGNSAQCNPSDWVNQASTAWQQANPGKDIGIYRHRLLITPNYWDNSNRHCGWGGVAQVGCGSWCWAIGADPDTIMHGVIVHELGHNVGFNHARTDQNNNGYDSRESSDSEYGDNSDMMGSSRNWKKFNAPHAEDKGWIDPFDYEIRTVTPAASPQLFDVLPMDDEAWDWPGLRALKLERSSTSDYYVTFRRASGDYNNLESEYRDRVSIHYGFDNNTYSYFVTTLAAGQSFTDPVQDLVITATSAVPVSNGGNSTTAMGVEICRQNCSAFAGPSNLTAVAVSTSDIDVAWDDGFSDEDGFDIERSRDGGAWSAVWTTGPNTSSYADTGLESGMDYAYRVRASSPAGDSGWSNVASAKTLGIPPVADFSFVTSYLQASFSDRSSDSDGSIVSRSWNFGDGGSSTAQNPVHVYSLPNTYTVSLTVTDEDGYSHSDSQDVTVFEAPNVAPTANFSSAVSYLQASFSDSSFDSDGSVASWSWSFGDGNASTARNPTHDYAAAGSYSVTLRVTDNDGDSGSVSKSVTVSAPPPYVDYPAVGETSVAGAVSGSYAATAENDGAVESLTERESGGRKSDRYSYLEHQWSFSIPAGTSVRVLVNAWQAASDDGDTFEFAWSSNGSNWTPMFEVSALTDGTPIAFELPADTSGTVYLRVTDTDRGAGNNSLDRLFVDYLQVRVNNGTPEPLAGLAPSGLGAEPASFNTITLDWDDNTSNEAGFSIERSEGGAFIEVATTAPNAGAIASYTDTGLASNRNYRYRVRAFKGADASAYSNEAAATTEPPAAVTLTASGYKVKGVQNADLTWSGATTATVNLYRDGSLMAVSPVSNTGSYADNIGNKGGGSYTYQVCETGAGGACSSVETVTF